MCPPKPCRAAWLCMSLTERRLEARETGASSGHAHPRPPRVGGRGAAVGGRPVVRHCEQHAAGGREAGGWARRSLARTARRPGRPSFPEPTIVRDRGPGRRPGQGGSAVGDEALAAGHLLEGPDPRAGSSSFVSTRERSYPGQARCAPAKFEALNALGAAVSGWLRLTTRSLAEANGEGASLARYHSEPCADPAATRLGDVRGRRLGAGDSGRGGPPLPGPTAGETVRVQGPARAPRKKGGRHRGAGPRLP